ncbi:MAG: MoxR family ATPase [candidate division Zixibacteria bacterium]|nr:MoxR family ATPase [candidate division Zixibacteria bacterium]
MHEEIEKIQSQVEKAAFFVRPLQDEVGKVIVGQKYMVDRMLIGLLTGGHILIEGVPGLAKTLAVRTLSAAIDAGFQRIQFTPDLLPADLIGTMIYSPQKGEFSVKKGPIFANFILADEINRAPAKVQSALLEAMQEKQVTIGEKTFPLEEPFLVMATQNPIEQEGTYPLPEAQLDRFIFKLSVGYPNRKEELEILNRETAGTNHKVEAVIKPKEILAAREVVHKIYVDEKVKEYILNIVFATREPKAYKVPVEGLIAYGASPRATIFLTLAAKAHAFMAGRGYVTPEDVKAIGLDVLRHRVLLTFEAEAEEMSSDAVVRKVFDQIEVP